jgi:aspartate carbamoyltransferase catalytic subunit
MLRLGGEIITSDDPTASSAKKGESLADTIRVIANYADIIVIRHPRDGAARLAAEYSPIPVINGGDGSHEHPTQTLCDLFTLTKKGRSDHNKKPRRLEGMKVAISGDLKGSRTIHSFVYALARFGAIIEPMPASGMELPAHVDRRLREEFQSKIISKDGASKDGGNIDVLYVTSDKPHQQSLFAGPEVDEYGALIQKKVDAVYVTRFQKERWADDKEKSQPYLKIDAQFMKDKRYSDASVMHPLPRVGELDVALDSDRRAVYFQQAAYGVPIRMALITLLLGLKNNKSLQKLDDGFVKPSHPIYAQPANLGIRCINENCISLEPSEQLYVANKFYVLGDAHSHNQRLRCVYCEKDIEEDAVAKFVVGDATKHHYTRGIGSLSSAPPERLRHLVIWACEADAEKAGFRPKDAGKVAKAS